MKESAKLVCSLFLLRLVRQFFTFYAHLFFPYLYIYTPLSIQSCASTILILLAYSSFKSSSAAIMMKGMIRSLESLSCRSIAYARTGRCSEGMKLKSILRADEFQLRWGMIFGVARKLISLYSLLNSSCSRVFLQGGTKYSFTLLSHFLLNFKCNPRGSSPPPKFTLTISCKMAPFSSKSACSFSPQFLIQMDWWQTKGMCFSVISGIFQTEAKALNMARCIQNQGNSKCFFSLDCMARFLRLSSMAQSIVLYLFSSSVQVSVSMLRVELARQNSSSSSFFFFSQRMTSWLCANLSWNRPVFTYFSIKFSTESRSCRQSQSRVSCADAALDCTMILLRQEHIFFSLRFSSSSSTSLSLYMTTNPFFILQSVSISPLLSREAEGNDFRRMQLGLSQGERCQRTKGRMPLGSCTLIMRPQCAVSSQLASSSTSISAFNLREGQNSSGLDTTKGHTSSTSYNSDYSEINTGILELITWIHQFTLCSHSETGVLRRQVAMDHTMMSLSCRRDTFSSNAAT